MGRVIKVGRGRSEVTITGSLAEGIEADLRKALGPVADELDRVTDGIMARVHAEWPVKSSESRDAWRSALRVQPQSWFVESVLYNPLTKVRYILSTKVGRQRNATRLRSPLVALVRTPVREAKRELKQTLPPIIGRVLQEGVD